MIGGGILSTADMAVFEALNALVGRSWLLDSVIAASLDNSVVKAGPIGACFVYAWFARDGRVGPGRGGDARRRRILLVTLLSLFVIAPASKLLSEGPLAPRPFVQGEQLYLYQGEELEELKPIEVRQFAVGEVGDRIRLMKEGRIEANDLGSFPSDHAALYFALALGIFLASPMAGAFAIAWALAFVFFTRIAVGLHWPIDLLAGAACGSAILLALQFAAARLGQARWDAFFAWAEPRKALFSAILFLLLLEAVTTMPTMERGREIAGALLERVS